MGLTFQMIFFEKKSIPKILSANYVLIQNKVFSLVDGMGLTFEVGLTFKVLLSKWGLLSREGLTIERAYYRAFSVPCLSARPILRILSTLNI